MWHQDLIEISEAPDLPSLEKGLLRFAQGRLGFGMFSAALAIDKPGQAPGFMMIGNTPKGFAEASRSVPNFQRDPVIKRLKTSSIPFAYDQRTYVDAGAADLWDNAAFYGYKTGIASAMHLPGRRHLLLGFDREQRLPASEALVAKLMGQLHLLAMYAQGPALRLLQPVRQVPVQREQVVSRLSGGRSLSATEREVLQWTRVGKTVGEIGDLLKLSETAVGFHIRAAVRKTGATNKYGAASRAAMRGAL